MTDKTASYKSNRGRPPNAVPKDDWHIHLDRDISLYFRLKYLDPLSQRMKQGAMSELVNRLLREEMRREQLSETLSPGQQS